MPRGIMVGPEGRNGIEKLPFIVKIVRMVSSDSFDEYKDIYASGFLCHCYVVKCSFM
jgi:hypothetical protein